MNENSLLIKLLEELIHRLEKEDELESRINLLEEKLGISENSGALPKFRRSACSNEKSVNDCATDESNTIVKSEEIQRTEQTEKIMYFESLLRNADCEYYVELDKLHTMPDNYQLIIHGEQAEAYVTSDKEKIEKMFEDYRKYLFPLKRPNIDPPKGCGIETIEPGIFKFKDNRWYMEKKISINYL